MIRITRTIFSLSILLFSVVGAIAQPDSCHTRISLLTCSPGEELYSSWGHTAIRVTDSARGSDIVFNYGTFDYDDPLFLAKFTKGLMIYYVSAYPFSEFVEEYQYYKRGVLEQELNLSCEAKATLYDALVANSREENKYYEYYFHTDNCTTRAKDMIVKNSGGVFNFRRIIPEPAPTFRNLIHVYLDSSKQYWNKLGIDILLGAQLDKKASNEQAMFLPDYLLSGFDNATINGKPLVTRKLVVLPAPEISAGNSLLSPLVIFSILALIIIVLSLRPNRIGQKILQVFDVSFFLILGLLGILLLVLWIIRIDTVCRDNYNLLWALPSHVPVAFLLLRNKSWVKKYFRVVGFLSIILLLAWFFLPQQLNAALIPIVIIIITRSWQRSK